MSKDLAVPMSTKRALPEKLPMQNRSFAVRAEEPGEDNRIALKFSSPNPVKRMTWGSMWWNEVLSHAPGAVITDRLAQGVALLVNHDPNQRAGILEDGAITKDGGTGFARYNSTQFGKDTETEVREKTLPWISVGYIVHSETRVADIDPADDEDPDYLGTYEADSWEPCEVSHVAIPADINSGVGRDLSHLPQYPVRFAGKPATPPAPTERSTKEKTMEPTEVPTPAAQVLSNDAMKLERERTAGIRLLARQFPDVVTREFEEKAIGEGMSRDAVAAQVLEKKREKESAANAGGQVQLSEKEKRNYSFMRVMRSIAAPAGTHVEGRRLRTRDLAADCEEPRPRQLRHLHPDDRADLPPHQRRAAAQPRAGDLQLRRRRRNRRDRPGQLPRPAPACASPHGPGCRLHGRLHEQLRSPEDDRRHRLQLGR